MNLPGLIPEHISCHQVRHTRAMNLQAEGVSLVWIRDLLGHESVQTTEIYARTASRQRQEAIEKASEMLNPNPVLVNGIIILIFCHGLRVLAKSNYYVKSKRKVKM